MQELDGFAKIIIGALILIVVLSSLGNRDHDRDPYDRGGMYCASGYRC